MTQTRTIPLATLLALALTPACATTREGGPPSTDISVLDEHGDGIAGEIKLWSRKAEDKCVQEAQSCFVEVPAGFYTLTFLKMRAGRLGMGQGRGGAGEKTTGCLRARVQLLPGKKVVCKKRGEFNCEPGGQETMDCGEAAATRYGYTPRPGDAIDDSAK
jgi:hypothetical protein